MLGDEPADRLAAQRGAECGLAGVALAVAGGEHERRDAPAEAERLEPAAELGPSSSPPIAADSTSPASRRSVVSATRRRSSSSAITVTA